MNTRVVQPGLSETGYPGSLRSRWPRAVYAPADQAADKDEEEIRVLLVEDDYLVGLQAEEALKAAGFEVIGPVATAKEAVEAALRERPAVAIVDIRLAGPTDGVAAALEIFRSMGIRSIFATAHHDPQTQARAEAATPLGWLPKPYSMEALVRVTERAVAELKKT